MRDSSSRRLFPPLLVILVFSLLVLPIFVTLMAQQAEASNRLAPVAAAPDAACAGGPTIDGITLDECYVHNFNVDGTGKSITVWYTKDPTTADREVDGETKTLEHWINSDAEAVQVAEWGEDAWQRFYEVFGRHPYDTGCNDNINIQMEDGVGWGGIAYWASSGNCNIGIDSPMVRNGGGQGTVYHEFMHYLQYAYDDGCYDDINSHYDANAEYVEGYADLGADSVDAVLDAGGSAGWVSGYDPMTSFFSKSYNNVWTKYFVEQVGSDWTPADPHHGLDALAAHYHECDNQDTLYVLDTVIPAETGGALNEEKLFLNFFAANWAKDWADPVTQPELVYTDDDGLWYGNIALSQDVSLSTSQSWTNESTPADWAGQYYQVTPQSSCDYVTVEVDGEAGAKLGINLMAADTSGSTSVSRSAWIGEDFTRTFAGDGVHHRVVAVVNAFDHNYDYDVNFTCVTPQLEVLEPRANPNFVLVGEPSSPIAFLSRFKVTSGGAPVRGLPQSAFTADAEGDSITFLPGSFQEVGTEYWAVLVPPVKPAGTTFINFEACLDNAICDTETDGLLYVAPGNSDIAMVFDASGSMTTEDVPGEGERVENAQKAGHLLADLLRTDDRVLVMDFSATDNPAGCGLPGGDGDCPLDLNIYLNRTDVTGSGTILSVHNAIDQVNAREWTPIAGALVEAKNRLQNAPYSLNPKHIILLSDGEENVNPLYADVRTELIDSGVIINTVGFSDEAPEALLAQIAADTGGTYRYVPAAPGTLRAQAMVAEQAQMEAMGLSPAMIDQVQQATAYLPGPLALDEVYDYLETTAQDASRISLTAATTAEFFQWSTDTFYVDDSATLLRMVVAAKDPSDGSISCGSTYRETQVLPPGADPRQGWIQVAPSAGGAPATWVVQSSAYDDVVMVPAPADGDWAIRTRYSTYICGPEPESPTAPDAPLPVLFSASIQSEYRLQGRFLEPIAHNQGVAGDQVPLVATLMERTGTIPGATVLAIVERPGGGSNAFYLVDDGTKNDGAAGDGIYGGTFFNTALGGTYNVTILAGFLDPAGSGEYLLRWWEDSFWIDGPERDDPDNQDRDQDAMPDPWEERCGLNTSSDDSALDLDKDGLNNYGEWQRGTLACDPDTDGGGERDGSEVANGRNPLDPADDFVRPFTSIEFRPLDASILVRWTPAFSYTKVIVVLTDSDGRTVEVDAGDTGEFIIPDLTNGLSYEVYAIPHNDPAIGRGSEPVHVTPKEDPLGPRGAVLINNGAPTTLSRNVLLHLSASDSLSDGAYRYATAALANQPYLMFNTPSGVKEMRISNSPTFAGASWEPYTEEKGWTLAQPVGNNLYTVYVQYRDGAGNVSMVVTDDILVEGNGLYLPVIIR